MSRIVLSLALVLWVGASGALAQDAGGVKRGSAEERAAVVNRAARQAEAAARASAGKRSGARAATRAASRSDAAGASEWKRLVYRLKHTPASEVARAIEAVLASERKARQAEIAVVIVPEVVSNSLILSGAPAVLDVVKDLVEQLDRRPAEVVVRLLIAEVALGDEAGTECGGLVLEASQESLKAAVAELKRHGDLQMLARAQIRTLDSQPASILIGHRLPRVTGTAVSSRGRTNNVSMEEVGLMVGLTPRVNVDGRVTMEINVEQSHFGPASEGVPISISSSGDGSSGDVIRTPRTDTLTAQTTVSVESGKAVILAGLVSKSELGWRELVIILTPQVVGGGGQE